MWLRYKFSCTLNCCHFLTAQIFKHFISINYAVSICFFTDTINLVWTAGFLGYTVGSIVTGYVFRRFCTTNRKKMLFLWLTFFGNGAIMISLPFINNFPGLVFARCLQNIFLGAYITADTSLVVYTMGPIKSRYRLSRKTWPHLFIK